MLINKRIHPDIIRSILIDFMRISSQKRKLLAQYLDFDENRFKNYLDNKTKITFTEETKILQWLDSKLDNGIALEVLFGKYKNEINIENSTFSEVSNNLSNYYDIRIDEQLQFREKCKTGLYIIFRMTGDNRLISSIMRIYFSKNNWMLPRFVTFRPRRNRGGRKVKGIIFQKGHSIYSIGQRPEGFSMRMSILNYHTRANRTDLVGIRTSFAETKSNAPFAHKIYCYQLVKKRTRKEIRSLIGVFDKAQQAKIFHDLTNFEQISAELSKTNVFDNGLIY